jgi:Leucine-rich repeat (LRR) protein
MASLTRLNAAHNRLSSLPESFGALRRLRTAFFLGCDFETLPGVLGTLPELFMLSFKANRLARVPADSLAPSLVWLILSDNRLAHLPDSIGRLLGLRKLVRWGRRTTHEDNSAEAPTHTTITPTAHRRQLLESDMDTHLKKIYIKKNFAPLFILRHCTN